ncbi:MAG: phage tail assembly chaperone [Henriciella sp.]|uniref:phage tail assembly chaperone n=1 Tax=Henriciella sp. TaxID=1968823 RepID=UPI0032EB6822
MLPWAEMMRMGIAMGLSPPQVWACSLREWLWLTGQGGRTLARTDLTRLLQQFPDTKEAFDGKL